MKPSILAFLVLFIFTSPSFTQDAPLQGLDEYIEQAMPDWGIPGMAVAVVKDDEIVYARGFGIKKLGENDPVDEHTLFGIASTTKAMTAAALAMLVDEGRLDWDDPVVKHLPDFKLYDPFVTSEVTVRDLLVHRVGVGRMTGNRIQFMPQAERSEIIYRMRYLEPEQSFRSSYVYSNVMYMVAGELIPAITGISWDDFLARRIFGPLGMNSSNTSITQIGHDDNAAWPHQEIRGEVVTIPRRDWNNVAPSAAVNSTVYDIAQWLRLHLGEPGVYDEHRLLSEEVMREMHQAQFALRVSDPYGGLASYGLGWRLGEYNGYRTASHGGATDGMNTNLTLVPEADLGIIVLTNTFNQLTTAVVNRIIDAYIDAPVQDWSRIHLNGYSRLRAIAEAGREEIHAARKHGTEPTFSLQGYEGTYADSLYGEVEVRLEEDKLVLHFWDSTDQIADLEHWHLDTFRAHWRNPAQREKFVHFTLNQAGEIGELNVQFTLRPIFLQVGIYPSNYTRMVRFERK